MLQARNHEALSRQLADANTAALKRAEEERLLELKLTAAAEKERVGLLEREAAAAAASEASQEHAAALARQQHEQDALRQLLQLAQSELAESQAAQEAKMETVTRSLAAERATVEEMVARLRARSGLCGSFCKG